MDRRLGKPPEVVLLFVLTNMIPQGVSAVDVRRGKGATGLTESSVVADTIVSVQQTPLAEGLDKTVENVSLHQSTRVDLTHKAQVGNDQIQDTQL